MLADGRVLREKYGEEHISWFFLDGQDGRKAVREPRRPLRQLEKTWRQRTNIKKRGFWPHMPPVAARACGAPFSLMERALVSQWFRDLRFFGSFFHHTAEGIVPSLIFVRSFYKGRDSFVPRKEFMEKHMGEGHIPRRFKLSRWKSRRPFRILEGRRASSPV